MAQKRAQKRHLDGFAFVDVKHWVLPSFTRCRLMFCSHLASKVRRRGCKLWDSRSRLKDLCLWRFLFSLLILGIWGKHFRLPDWRKRFYTLWSICQKTYSRHWQNYSMARCFDSCTNIATVCYTRITSLSTFTTPSLNIYNTPCCCRWSSS